MSDENNQAGAERDYKSRWSDHKIGYLIRSTKQYIVYIDTDGYLDWSTTTHYDANEAGSANFSAEKRNAIIADAALLEVTPCDGLSAEARQQFKRLIGESLVCCFDLDYVSAKKTLLAAQQFVRARSEEISRYWYLSASILAWIPFAAVSVVAWLYRDWLIAFIGLDAFWLLLALTFGAYGALLSVFTRAGNLQFDCAAGRNLHRLEALSRIGSGAIAALLVALAVRSGIVLSALAHDRQLHPVMLLAALVAGAGERLAPSIITTFESTKLDISARVKPAENTGRESA